LVVRDTIQRLEGVQYEGEHTLEWFGAVVKLLVARYEELFGVEGTLNEAGSRGVHASM
jgi:hypothetical protein